MTDQHKTTGWPDPARPGVPLNPERDGWHWFAGNPPYPLRWSLEYQGWAVGGGWIERNAAMMNAYLGPCLTPAEVAAQVHAARRLCADAMREAAARAARHACLVPPDGGSPSDDEVAVCDEAERRIRALPLPGDDTR